MIEKATTADQQEPLFKVAIERHWTTALAVQAVKDHGLSEEDAELLAAMHAARQRGRRRFYARWGPPGVAGAVIAVLGFVTALIPKESFEVLEIADDYGSYRLAMAGALAFALGMASLHFGSLASPTRVHRGGDIRE